MKVLFAVSNENISEAIIKRYQEKYKEVMSYKNVYYFNAVIKELQKDKTYDRIIISEDLEVFSNNNALSIDKFLFLKMDKISDEAQKDNGENIPIIYIASEKRNPGADILNKYFSIGIYNVLLGNDRTITKICNLINQPRGKKDAKNYYQIEGDNAEYVSQVSKNPVSDEEIRNILRYYRNIQASPEKFSETFDRVAAQYNEEQNRYIMKNLPEPVKTVLEQKNQTYRTLLNIDRKNTEIIVDETILKQEQQKQEQQNNINQSKVQKQDLNENKNIQSDTKQVQQPKQEQNTEQNKQKVIIPGANQSQNTQKPVITQEQQQKQNNKQQIKPQQRIQTAINQTQTNQQQTIQNQNNENNLVNKDNLNQQNTVETQVEQQPKQEVKQTEQKNQQLEQLNAQSNNLNISETGEIVFPVFNEPQNNDELIPKEVMSDINKVKQNQNIQNQNIPNNQSLNSLENASNEESTQNKNIETNSNINKKQVNKIKETQKKNVNEQGSKMMENSISPTGEIVFNPKMDKKDTDLYKSVDQDELFKTDTNLPSGHYEQQKKTLKIPKLERLLSDDKKVAIFVGTSKNGTSFLINSLGMMFSSIGIKTAILDMTRNKNSYYICTNNDEELKKMATSSTEKLKKGIAEGVPVAKNLHIYTSLPDNGKDYSDAETILSTLIQNYTIVLIDADFATNFSYFAGSQEIYLVQTLDILTMQALTNFLKELKAVNILTDEKVKVVINKEVPIKGITKKIIIGGISTYNHPSMTYMKELFDKNTVKACSIPFDQTVYQKYLENIIYCRYDISGYPKKFIDHLKILAGMVYPLISKQNSSNIPRNQVKQKPMPQNVQTNNRENYTKNMAVNPNQGQTQMSRNTMQNQQVQQNQQTQPIQQNVNLNNNIPRNQNQGNINNPNYPNSTNNANTSNQQPVNNMSGYGQYYGYNPNMNQSMYNQGQNIYMQNPSQNMRVNQANQGMGYGMYYPNNIGKPNQMNMGYQMQEQDNINKNNIHLNTNPNMQMQNKYNEQEKKEKSPFSKNVNSALDKMKAKFSKKE